MQLYKIFSTFPKRFNIVLKRVTHCLLCPVLLLIVFYRNGWRREHSKEWSSDFAQLPLKLSQQSWLYPDHPSCRGQHHPMGLHRLLDWTNAWLCAACGWWWDKSYAWAVGHVRQSCERICGKLYQQLKHCARQVPHWQLGAENWLETEVDWTVNTSIEV